MSSSTQQNIKVVERFLSALREKDLMRAPVAEDIVFEEPMMGRGQGTEELRASIEGFLPALTDIRIIRHVAEAEYVVTEWEADGHFGTIPILERFRVVNGRVVEFRAFFDPRPIFG